MGKRGPEKEFNRKAIIRMTDEMDRFIEEVAEENQSTADVIRSIIAKKMKSAEMEDIARNQTKELKDFL